MAAEATVERTYSEETGQSSRRPIQGRLAPRPEGHLKVEVLFFFLEAVYHSQSQPERPRTLPPGTSVVVERDALGYT
jgi:hypothetical protein